jgi:hypothetical protein
MQAPDNGDGISRNQCCWLPTVIPVSDLVTAHLPKIRPLPAVGTPEEFQFDTVRSLLVAAVQGKLAIDRPPPCSTQRPLGLISIWSLALKPYIDWNRLKNSKFAYLHRDYRHIPRLGASRCGHAGTSRITKSAPPLSQHRRRLFGQLSARAACAATFAAGGHQIYLSPGFGGGAMLRATVIILLLGG